MTSRKNVRWIPLPRSWVRAAAVSLALAGTCAGSALSLGCSGPDVRAPNPTRPLDERRAIEVIRRALQQEGVDPGPSREVKIQPSGKTLKIDVGVRDHDYGIAYITSEDAHELGDAIPPPNKKDERLRILRAGDDGETRVVVLYQDNYLYDDLAGEQHEQTTIQVESQLTRDVQDFLVHAKSQKYK